MPDKQVRHAGDGGSMALIVHRFHSLQVFVGDALTVPFAPR
jgi:hypothetical protein